MSEAFGQLQQLATLAIILIASFPMWVQLLALVVLILVIKGGYFVLHKLGLHD